MRNAIRYKIAMLTEVSYLGIHVCIKQHIFRLQISMYYHMPVTVIHARKDLLEQTSTFLLIKLRQTKVLNNHEAVEDNLFFIYMN